MFNYAVQNMSMYKEDLYKLLGEEEIPEVSFDEEDDFEPF